MAERMLDDTTEQRAREHREGIAPPIEPELLFNVSERRLRKAKPQSYTEVFVPEAGKRRFKIIGVQDDTEIEKMCRERAKNAPDLRLQRNKDDAKRHLAASFPEWVAVKHPELVTCSDPVELHKIVIKLLRKYPQFMCQKRRTLGV